MYRERWKKYGNKSASFGGYTYASKKEASVAEELEMRKKAGDIIDWERQKRVELYGQHQKICEIIVDFFIYHKDGMKEFLEVKGMVIPPWPTKWALLQDNFADDPTVKFSVVR